jgi:two-component system chemotaxis response regulator CheY
MFTVKRLSDTANKGPNAMKNCLIVDDSRVIRKVSRHIVETLGFEVDEAADGQEALAKCDIAMPDVILLDWNMPVMSGLQFLGKLGELNPAHRPKVMFCTTESDDSVITSGIAAGAAGFVIKPFNEQTLRTALERIGAI